MVVGDVAAAVDALCTSVEPVAHPVDTSSIEGGDVAAAVEAVRMSVEAVAQLVDAPSDEVGDVAAVRDLGTNVEPIRVSDGRGTKVRTTCGEDR